MNKDNNKLTNKVDDSNEDDSAVNDNAGPSKVTLQLPMVHVHQARESEDISQTTQGTWEPAKKYNLSYNLCKS